VAGGLVHGALDAGSAGVAGLKADHGQHPGRLVLWVGDQDMSKARQPAFPLAKHGTVDLFKPVPFGTDQRGRPVKVTLMFTAAVTGSIPRMGKTFLLRLLALIAGLDPRAALYLFDLKGTGDLPPLEPVAHRYRAGEEDEDIAYGLAAMRELQGELRRRAQVIRGLPPAGTSRPWSSGWPRRTPDGGTAGSTAGWPAWESTSRRRPYGRSSRPAASTPRHGGPGRPGRNSCAPGPG
jgi:hypothetical protein